MQLTDDPAQAAKGAAASTPTSGHSMGQEEERARRLAAFAGHTIDDALVEQADPTPWCSTASPRTGARRSPTGVLEVAAGWCGARRPTAATAMRGVLTWVVEGGW